MVQVMWGPQLSALAEQQRTRVYVEPARRGAIEDRNGHQLAYTMQARALTVSPIILRRELAQRYEMYPDFYADVDQTLADMATGIPEMLKGNGSANTIPSSEDILAKLQADTSYEVLAPAVDPDLAAQIAEKYFGVAADRLDTRQYPNGAVAENIIGKVSSDGEGQFGFELSSDALLAGIDGKRTEDVSTNGQVIPGTARNQIPAIDGSTIQLTIDLDLQTYLQQQLEQAKKNSGAKAAEAVVLDAKSGQVLAMANADTINPNGDIAAQLRAGRSFDNTTISTPFEPGSVAKIITAAAAIEYGLTTPDEVLTVPGSISMAGVTVRDAWVHGDIPYTTTGIFGKSSNVGTLMLAQRVGDQRFYDMARKFGIGTSTGIELPNESSGVLPDITQWSGGTFANLPIGQGMSMTLLQMTSMYQAIANDGVRVQPRIIKQITRADGTVEPLGEPEKTTVVSAQTAATVRDMFRAVTQSDPMGYQNGTGPTAAIEGYQITGKTGTAQQVDPNTGAYSNSEYWITFAGIAPADNPRFVIGIMLDRPERGVHGEGGQSAAPLFHDIAAWLLNRDNVPLSAPANRLTLDARQ
ncbi:MAG: penicillin-binding protein 2 [Corynebacterium sp.]|nr:penicillin-binding protein 2 [Corynebacterium sp.]